MWNLWKIWVVKKLHWWKLTVLFSVGPDPQWHLPVLRSCRGLTAIPVKWNLLKISWKLKHNVHAYLFLAGKNISRQWKLYSETQNGFKNFTQSLWLNMKQVESPRRASQRQVFPLAGLARWSGSCSSHKPTRNPKPSRCHLSVFWRRRNS